MNLCGDETHSRPCQLLRDRRTFARDGRSPQLCRITMSAPSSEDFASRGTIRKIWIALPFVFLLWGGLHTQFLVLDFWWHLKLGEIIVTTRSIPVVDLFSFTAGGQPFVAQNWLAEILLFLFFRMMGFEGLVLVGTSLLLATLFFVHRISSGHVRGVRAVAASNLLVVIGLMLCSNLRTQLFSFLFFAITYWALEDFRAGGWKKLAVLPVMMLGWVNMHGAFVLGLLLVITYVSIQTVSSWLEGSLRERGGSLRRAAVILLLTALATLANPSGWRVYEYVALVSHDPASRSYVREWQPPRIEEPEMLLAIFIPAGLVLLSMIVSRRRPEAIELVLIFGFLAFALLSRRNTIWFSLIAGPILARQIEQISWTRVGKPGNGGREPSAAFRRALNGAIVSVLIVVSVLASPWVYPRLGNETLGTSLFEKRTPIGAVDFMEKNQMFGRMFHSQIYGDYLIWRLWPRQKTFIDGRVHLFPLEISDGYIKALNAFDWEERFSGWDIEYVLLSKDVTDTRLLRRELGSSDRWRKVFEDQSSVLYSRAGRR